ncbi:hypothetical protein LCGC14_1240740 [marine sediment metagenome]|uniref:DUF2399 domain-containing protein n=1 Tax=marine sediment metagenome TaxID=412755 RepID=A0A0F9L5U9_9ZZZZ
MPKITYRPDIRDRILNRSRQATRTTIEQAEEIIVEYEGKGFVLTLRQLYYQFVSRGFLVNTQASYNRLGFIMTDARLAGLIDWNAIIDRTRNQVANPHWGSPVEILDTCASQFLIDRWGTQKNRVEVWIEKEALVGVIEGTCADLDVPFFSCRGYTSASEMWRMGYERMNRFAKAGQHNIILHLGDHDPSGMDMTNDIIKRLTLFTGKEVDLRRLALNMDQIEEFNPPPNFAKPSDKRYKKYKEEYGENCWELDALEPGYMAGLIEKEVKKIRSEKPWRVATAIQNRMKQKLRNVTSKVERDDRIRQALAEKMRKGDV